MNMPSAALLPCLLRYEPDTGRLFWLPRSPNLFSDGQYPASRACLTWNARFSGAEAFTAQDGNGYRVGAIRYRPFRAHRVIWALMTGAWPVEEIDHINGDRVDNRWSNLREVSRSENNKNAALYDRNKSGSHGVAFVEKRNRWRAYISVNGKFQHIGHFCSREEAIIARASAERALGFHPNHGRQSIERKTA